MNFHLATTIRNVLLEHFCGQPTYRAKLCDKNVLSNINECVYQFLHPLQPRRLLLFCWQKSKQKTMSAESASLKIGYTSLKIRNLSPFHSAFKQTDFLRFVPPIFLTLTSQDGNQGIANAMDKKTKYVFERFRFFALQA